MEPSRAENLAEARRLYREGESFILGFSIINDNDEKDNLGMLILQGKESGSYSDALHRFHQSHLAHPSVEALHKCRMCVALAAKEDPNGWAEAVASAARFSKEEQSDSDENDVSSSQASLPPQSSSSSPSSSSYFSSSFNSMPSTRSSSYSYVPPPSFAREPFDPAASSTSRKSSDESQQPSTAADETKKERTDEEKEKEGENGTQTSWFSLLSKIFEKPPPPSPPRVPLADDSPSASAPNASATSNSADSKLDTLEAVLNASTHWEVLGVTQASSSQDISSSYKKKARHLHPDKNPHPRAEDAFKKLQKAYTVLSDDDSRSHYERFGKDADEEVSLEELWKSSRWWMKIVIGIAVAVVFGWPYVRAALLPAYTLLCSVLNSARCLIRHYTTRSHGFAILDSDMIIEWWIDWSWKMYFAVNGVVCPVEEAAEFMAQMGVPPEALPPFALPPFMMHEEDWTSYRSRCCAAQAQSPSDVPHHEFAQKFAKEERRQRSRERKKRRRRR